MAGPEGRDLRPRSPEQAEGWGSEAGDRDPLRRGLGLRTATVLCVGGIIGVIAGLVRTAEQT